MDMGRQKDPTDGSEDAVYLDPLSGVYIVADGIGGHLGADEASILAVEIVGERLSSARKRGNHDYFHQILQEACNEANDAVYQKGREPNTLDMGTTLTAGMFRGHHLYIAHVGDSRIYSLNHNGMLVQLTTDHTPVQRAYDGHFITYAELFDTEGTTLLNNHVGKSSVIDPDILHYHASDIEKLLFTSDGLVPRVHDSEILAVLERDTPPQDIADALVELANYPQIAAAVVSELTQGESNYYDEKLTIDEARELIGGGDHLSVMVLDLGGSNDRSR